MAGPGKGRATQRYDPNQHGAPTGPSQEDGSRRAARQTEVAIDGEAEAHAPQSRAPRVTVRATQRYEPKDHPKPAPPPAPPRAAAEQSSLDALRSPPRAPTLARPKRMQPAAPPQVKKAPPPKPSPPPPEPEPVDEAPTRRSDDDARLPAVGDTIEERYRVVRPIGVGGMGHVFLVDHVRLQKQLALKVLSPEVLELEGGEAQKARFLREARAASRLQHPGIVEVIDFGSTKAGLPFIVMEYLSGEDLADRLDRTGPMTWPQAKGFIVQVLEALAVAHAHGVVHRDIKPENCFLSRSAAGTETVKLVDFGIAKVLTEVAGAGPLTQRGELLGTPQYMSPEQALGRAVDSRSDVYAVGVLLYELLSGAPPFDHGTPMEVLTNQITTPPPPLAERVPGLVLPPGAVELIDRALAKEPDDRYESAAAMIEALHRVDAPPAPGPVSEEVAPISSSSGPAVAVPTPAPTQRTVWVVVAAIGIAAVLGVAAWALLGAS